MTTAKKGIAQESPPRMHRDQLYENLAKGNSRATQVLPTYDEYRLGHGDPLLKASVEYNRNVARLGASNANDLDREIHLIQQGALVSGLGWNDVVHLGHGNTQMGVPIIRHNVNKDEQKEGSNNTPHHWSCQEEEISGMGFNDIVHLPNGDTITIPIVPSEGSKSKPHHWNGQEEEVGGMGFNDVVHLPNGDTITIPVVPSSAIPHVQAGARKDIVLSKPLLTPTDGAAGTS